MQFVEFHLQDDEEKSLSSDKQTSEDQLNCQLIKNNRFLTSN